MSSSAGKCRILTSIVYEPLRTKEKIGLLGLSFMHSKGLNCLTRGIGNDSGVLHSIGVSKWSREDGGFMNVNGGWIIDSVPTKTGGQELATFS